MEQETLVVEVLPEDFRSAPNGFVAGRGDKGCVLQQALRRMYPKTYIQVGPFSVKIGEFPNQVSYGINMRDWGGMKSDMQPDIINDLSARAKESLKDIPTVSVTLTKE